MLPGPHRLKRPSDFGQAVRRGARAATPTVVVHVMRRNDQDPPEFTRVGFVVSKKVGNAVTRNRVKRRLRHLAVPLDAPFVTDVVVRALPAAATEPQRLGEDLRVAGERACAKAGIEFNWFNSYGEQTFLDYVKSSALGRFSVTKEMGKSLYQNLDLQVFYSRYLDLAK